MKVVIQLGLAPELVESLLSDSGKERAEALIYVHLGLDRALERALTEEPYDQEEEDE